MTNIRNSFNRLATALIAEGKKDSAIAVIDRCNELVPQEIIPYEYFALNLADSYLKAGATEKGVEMLEKAYTEFNDELSYYLALEPQLRLTAGVVEETQRDLFYLQTLERIARSSGQTEFAKKVGEALQNHFSTRNNFV